jgi:outer membrane protein assembly factor BamB
MAAREVYAFHGAADKIAIAFREGGHEHNLADWQVLLDFADRQFFGKDAGPAVRRAGVSRLSAGVHLVGPEAGRRRELTGRPAARPSLERWGADILYRMTFARPVFAIVVALALSVGSARAGSDWPQFRGPAGDGISDAKNLPVEWAEDENVTWKTPIHGKAWSSPVVMAGKIWLTTATEDGRRLSVLCVDAATGKVLRDDKLFDVEKPQYVHPFNSAASPTPAAEPGRLYVSFGSPGSRVPRHRDGQGALGAARLQCNHFRGPGSSPLIYDDLLILPFDGSDFQFVAAVDKHSGETKWKTNRSIDFQDLEPDGSVSRDGDMRKAFSTPRVSTLSGAPLVISVGSKAAYAYEPRTGTEVWRTEDRSAHSASVTPLVGPEFVYICTGLGDEQLWAIKPGGKGVINDTHVAWKVNKNVPGRPSPLLVDGRIYMVDDAGLASCVDAKTGADVWRGRLKGNYSASPIYAGGRLYFFSEDGVGTVIEAGGPKMKVVVENELDDGFMASPAVTGDALILRTRTHLYRVEQPTK